MAASDRTRDIRIEVEEISEGITAFRLHNRWTRILGFECTFYLLGDLLIDTGFPHAEEIVLDALESRKIRAVLCTHQLGSNSQHPRTTPEVVHQPPSISHHVGKMH